MPSRWAAEATEMPANRTYTFTDDANMDGDVVVRADLETVDSGVYFTDDDLSFTITIENDSDYTLKEPYIEVIVAVGDGKPEPLSRITHEPEDILPGDNCNLTGSVDAMVLEGHAIVGVVTPSLRSIDTGEKTVHYSADYGAKGTYEPLASFTVWDRDHYREVHERPQQAQRLAAFTSLAVVYLAMLQFSASIGFPAAGAVIATVVATGYLYRSGIPAFLTDDL